MNLKLNKLLTGIALLIFITSILVTLFISKSISKPLKKISDAAAEIAEGNFNVVLDGSGKDEVSQLAYNLQNVKVTVEMLVNDISVLSDRFDKGEIDAVIETEKYSGEYLKVVLAINSTFKELIADILEAIGGIKQLVSGDFDMQVKQYPGKKAIMNEIISTIKGNLTAINSDINDMIKSITNGNLDTYMREESYNGGWKSIAEGINLTFLWKL